LDSDSNHVDGVASSSTPHHANIVSNFITRFIIL